MPERKEKAASQEKYQLKWSVAASPVNVAATLGLGTESYVAEEASIVDEVASIERSEEIEEQQPVTEPAQYIEYPPVDNGEIRHFRSSPKSKTWFANKPSMKMSTKEMRILAFIGWDVVAAVGAALIAVGPASAMALRFGALGGVWAGVAALLWFLTSKLK